MNIALQQLAGEDDWMDSAPDEELAKQIDQADSAVLTWE
jgi:hypothetical protein